ncbi:MAG: AtpZ/AtpI family protein [Novosphingobium sp.]
MATDEPGEAPDGAEDPRLSSLEERLERTRRAEAKRTAPIGQPAALGGKGAGQGNRILSALIGAPLGAALIGWLGDRWFGTAPAGLLIMLFLGFGAAISQVIAISKERAD